jgi:hypothetical protein
MRQSTDRSPPTTTDPSHRSSRPPGGLEKGIGEPQGWRGGGEGLMAPMMDQAADGVWLVVGTDVNWVLGR